MSKVVDLRPQNVDLKLLSGDGPVLTFTVVDNSDAPVNLTGTVEAQIRLRKEDTGAPLDAFDVDLSNAATGVMVLTLTGSQTDGLAGGRKFNGFWDVQWTPTGAEPRTLCQGKIEVDLDVSR